jgi:aspartate racemase
MKNKKIGIIGGVGPQATHYLYGKIIDLAQKKYGAVNNDDYPHLLIESLPIPDFISDKSKIDVALDLLIDSTHKLQQAGADVVCIASNTVHILLPQIQANCSLKFISMVDLVSDECTAYGYNKVGLLATPVLTHSKLYDETLSSRGIALVKPNDSELPIVEQIIRSVLAGNNQMVDKEKYVALLNKLFDSGAEGIILGCTELPLAIDYSVLGKRVINSDEVLAEGIVDYYYNN